MSVLDSIPQPLKQQSKLATFLRNLDSLLPNLQFYNKDWTSLIHPISALHTIQRRLKRDHELYHRISELLEFLQQFYRDILSLTAEQVFVRVQPLRQWVFWLPPAILRGDDGDILSLATLAQLLTFGVDLDYLFPELGGPYFGPLSAGPIEVIYRTICTRKVAAPQHPDIQLAMSLMDLPLRVATKYRKCLQSWRNVPLPPHASPYHSIQDFSLTITHDDVPHPPGRISPFPRANG